ncbi:MAG TPA: hypothetical protein VGG72_28220 [Bryobacteraceae bacterium]
MKPTARNCASAVCLLLVNLFPASTWAQEPPPKLGIVIVEGEGAVNNLKDQTTHETVIQVVDDTQKPVAGAAVVFFLPNDGPGGTFFDGTKSLTVTTDAQGRATIRGIRFNRLSGQMKIRVTASSAGQTATATITQTNVGGPGGSPGMSTTVKVLLIAALAAGAATGAILATRGGSSSSSTAAPPITITAGTPTVGAP